MKKGNILRILIATLVATCGWLLAVYVSELFDSGFVLSRLVFGVVVSISVLAVITTLSRQEGNQKKLSFNLPKHLKLFGVGFLWFAVPATISLIGASLLGLIEVEVLKSPVEIIGVVLLVAGLVALSEAIPEEALLRGYIFSKLSESGKVWFTIFAQATIFTVFAFLIGALSDPLDASFIFTFGVVLGILRSETGSVATSIGFHLACMTFQQSFTGRWEIFAVSNAELLQTYIFGMIPLSVVTAILVTKMLNTNS